MPLNGGRRTRSRPLVSVIVPTRNRARSLQGTLQSVLAQDYPNLEVMIVDDNSSDDTRQVVRAMNERDRLQYTRHETRRGAAAARNTGAAMTEGSMLLFEDDDCQGVPNRLSLLVEALERTPTAAYAYSWMKDFTLDGRVARKGMNGPLDIGTPYALVRRSVFEEVGGFDEELPRLQDFDLWIRILAQYDAVEVPKVLFETVRSDTSISSSTEGLIEAAERMANKYRTSEFPPGHRSMMHRYLGGALLYGGCHRLGVLHFLRSIAAHPWNLRSWLGLAVAALGPGPYQKVGHIRNRISHRDAEQMPL